MTLHGKDLTGFHKVAHEGGCFVTGTFYNPETGETVTGCIRDYDYADGSRDNDELYYLPIDEVARVLWLHSRGIVLTGDTVRVVKGRKVPLGTVGTVESIRPYYDRYRRHVADYVYFTDGQRTNINNVELITK